MKYLIKLKDRDLNREVMIECPEDMTLEELRNEITEALYLSCSGEIGHSFLTDGKVYVPRPDVIQKLRSKHRGNATNQQTGNTDEREILSSEQFHLSDVFTVKESAILYQQIHRTYRTRVSCTLKDRV